MDGFLTPHFVHPDTKRFIWPLHPNYGDGTEKSIRARGKTVPWNQNTMLAGGYLNIAQAFELLGEEPATVAAYDGIVKAFTDAFFEKITKYTAMEQPVYNWSYASDDVGPDYRYDEDLGHGGYDFWGIYRAYLRGKAGIREADMIPFANTIRYVVIRPDGMATANRVNGAGPDRAGLGSTWIYGAYLRPDFYEVIAGTMVAGAKRDPMTTGRLLLAKHHKANGWTRTPPPAPPTGPDGGVPDTSPVAADGPSPENPPGGQRPRDAAPPEPAASAPDASADRPRGGQGPSPPPGPDQQPGGSMGGCACGAAASSSSGGGLAALLLVGLCLTRRQWRRGRGEQ